MSKTVDQKVVEMQLENKQFEENAQNSVKTLDALKKALNLEGATKGLDQLALAGKNFSLQNISDNVQALSDRFSTLGIVGMTVIQDLTNTAITFGKKMFDSLVLNPAKMGFSEYETQINAIQTVLANTASKGTTLKEVNSALDELNTYSDKTIYNFTEMTKNIGTFTAAGVDLKTSTQAIKGIANVAAISGSNSQQASMAMYQLSQALASGTVKLMDWNSVVNAGMGGQVLQNSLMETARVHGVAIDEMIKSEGSFRETLSKGWLTSEILTETLSKFTGDLNAQQLKTMGYTDDQIKGILELGKTANDAATKVKTFSQLKDTAMEAIQSGWGQTWRLVVGDFEEARNFFTDLSDDFGNLIAKSSNSRNAILSVWKDLGGRTELVRGFTNILKGLEQVLGLVEKAFTILFPPITGEQLFAFTKGFADLTEKFKIGSNVAKSFEKLFTGIASIFDLARLGVTSLVKGFEKLVSKIPISGNSILTFVGNLGDFLLKVKETVTSADKMRDVIGSIGDFFGTLGARIKSAIKNIFETLSTEEGLNGLKEKIGSTLGGLWENIALFFSNVSEKLGPFSDFIKKTFDGLWALLTNVGGKLAKIFENVKNAIFGISNGDEKSPFASLTESLTGLKPLEKIGEFLTKMFETLKEKVKEALPILASIGEFIKKAFSKVADVVKKAFSKVDFTDITNLVGSGALVGIFVQLKKSFESGGGVLESVKGVFDGIASTLDEVQNSLKAWQTNLKADTLTKLAIAIGIIAASLVAVSLVDSSKLLISLGVVVVLFEALNKAMENFSKLSSSGKGASTAGMAVLILGLAAGILVLSEAMRGLSGIDTKSILTGLTAISALTAAMVIAIKNLKDMPATTDIIKTALAIAIFSGGMLLMSSAVSALSVIDGGNTAKALLSIGAIMVALSAFIKFMNNEDGTLKDFSPKVAVSVLLLAGAMVAMSYAVSALGEIDQQKAIQGVLAIGAILLELSMFMKIAGDPAHMISTAIGVGLLAGALLLMVFPIEKLAAIPIETMNTGLVSMAKALGIIAIAMRALPSDTIGKSAGLAIAAVALLGLTGVLSILGGMPLENLAKGLFAISLTLAAIVAAMIGMKDAIVGAAALVIVTAALAGFVPILAALGAMPIQNIGIGLAAIIGFLTIMGVAGLLLKPVVSVLIAFSTAVALLGAAMFLVGAGVSLFAVGLASLIATLYALTPLIPQLAKNLASAMEAISDAIIKASPKINQALTTLLLGLLDTLSTITPALVTTILNLVTVLLQALADKAPDILQAGFDLLIGLLKGIRDNIGEVVTTAVDVVINFLNAITEKLPDFIDAGWKLIQALVDGFTDSVDEHLPQLVASIGRLIGEVIAGLVEGTVGGITAFQGAFKELVDAGVQAFKDLLGIHSPSTVFIDLGDNIVQGLIQGIIDKLGELLSNMRMLGESLLNAAREKIPEYLASGKEFIDNLIAGIGEKFEAAKAKAKELIDAVKKAMEDKKNEFINAGKNLIQGLIDGMASLLNAVIQKAKDIINAAIRAMMAAASMHSPSKKTAELGKYFVLGFTNGISKMSGKVGNTVSDLTEKAIQTMNDTVSLIADSIDSNMDASPVVRPVLDLDDIVSGAKKMDSFFGKKNLSLATSSNLGQMVGSNDRLPNNSENSEKSSGTSISFYQNNYSPETLSALDIYRNTRNQLRELKGLVVNT